MPTDIDTILPQIQILLDELHGIQLPLEALAHTPWHTVGLNSLDIVEALQHLEATFHVTVSNAALATVITFRDLAVTIIQAREGEPA